MSGEKHDVINISQAIDAGPFTAFQIFAIILCSLVAFLDGLDSQSIAVAAPLIAEKLVSPEPRWDRSSRRRYSAP